MIDAARHEFFVDGQPEGGAPVEGQGREHFCDGVGGPPSTSCTLYGCPDIIGSAAPNVMLHSLAALCTPAVTPASLGRSRRCQATGAGPPQHGLLVRPHDLHR